eukprot:jgi/Phyca11/502629/fgenesh2_kg.PHYCAscaffold_1_\
MNSIETEAAPSKEDELMEEMKVEDNDAPHQKKKRIRYLHDTDRHNIIKRIDKGEKQAALAREYGVTRAAICHINKNREEIIARYDLLIKQTQEINRAENVTNSFEEYAMVREVQSSSVLLLMTKLRDRRSGPETFRSVAGRLIMLLLEEAIAATNTHAVEMTTTTGHTTHGLQRTDEFCGVAIGSEGFPFLVLFRQMEPDAAHGSIHVEQEVGGLWRLEHLDLPRDISQYRFLLFSSTVNTGGAECKAVEALCDLGVQEDHITLMFILCSTDSLKAICNRFPRVRIITGAIDNEIDPQTQEIIPGLGDFVTRYNGE